LSSVELKLDRQFVQNAATDQLKRALCQTVIDLAHRFEAQVCAEGVENGQDLRTLIELGCDMAQGFFFAKPMEPHLFVHRLLERAKTRPDSGGTAPEHRMTAMAEGA
jgi:EAL domain-containing protein (putative c-di-GMP-specific phosphodiesterase class I)